MQQKITNYLPSTITLLIGLFFVLVLHIKTSYTLIPILLSIIGLGVLIPKIRSKKWKFEQSDKQLIGVFILYFIICILSVILYNGKGRELDLPSKLLIVLPFLAIFHHVTLNSRWILYAIVVGTLFSAVIGIVNFYILALPNIFPAHMYIQSGGIIMSMSLFCIAIALYFQQQQDKWLAYLSLLACGLGIFTCLINQARGAWIVAPIILALILWFDRHLLSKRLILVLLSIGIISASFGGDLIQKRWLQAQNEITLYMQNNNGSTSVGARLDMWKSAVIGIQEKPLLGWGVQGVREMRKSHYEQGLISQFASSFDHAHNQFLHDATTRGLLGLLALFGILLVPLHFFLRNLKYLPKNSLGYLWGILGCVHILSIIGYFMTQAFLSHNSGMMFYAFCTLLFYGLQKAELNRPLVKEH